MKTFVLILLLWNTGPKNEVVTHEFTSEAVCLAAVTKVERKFDGYGTKSYAVCTEK